MRSPQRSHRLGSRAAGLVVLAVGAGLAACNESTSALDDDERIGPVLAASMTPDPVALGGGGWAFGSGSMSRAATVANGVLYQANMDYMAFESIGDQKDAMVRVLELAIR